MAQTVASEFSVVPDLPRPLLGSALFVLLPSQTGMGIGDLSRMMQGVVTGIGFLCVGTILKPPIEGEAHVYGLAAAAGLWRTSAIGSSKRRAHAHSTSRAVCNGVPARRRAR